MLETQNREAPLPIEPTDVSIPVVGIGASAGGLEVFKLLLADLPANTGFAIVFIQHLAPNHPSMLAEILARSTAMPVAEASDGAQLEPNHVYVMPENVDLTVAGGSLKITARNGSTGLHLPIDRFLRSLADEFGNRAVGVILSGTGSDGSAGVEAIKGAGGVTFAQDTATSRFSAMPQAAIATGCVDFVLSPSGIAAELVRMSRHPYLAGTLPDGKSDLFPPGEAEDFASILALLRGATGVDFSYYRERTIKRRILRRLALKKIDTIAEYAERLQDDSLEVMALHRDLLISVTSFFRDKGAFEALKTVVFPGILQGKPAKETIRIWVPGCATGEEAFSIAICLQEYMNETGATFPVRIFASDISLGALEKARLGRYPENIAADVSAERLNRYFTKVEGGYQIVKQLREVCLFTKHNLIDDPPFSKLDLISCRNVLIYLGTVQKDIIRLFHYALAPGGFLILGSSEAGTSGDYFSVADRRNRIYSKRETARNPSFLPVLGASRTATGEGELPGPRANRLWAAADVRKEVDRVLLSKYSPSGAVVDAGMDVVEIRGTPAPYLALPAGKISFHLAQLIPDAGLFLETEKLILQVRAGGEPVRIELPHFNQDGSDLAVEALPLDSGSKQLTLVLFEPLVRSPVPSAEPRDLGAGSAHQERQVSRLKQQLADTRQRLLDSLDESQSALEESQNTTEEALSVNEELQSLNEELETAKEELQSTNEELLSVNDELHTKNTALVQSRDFAMSIVETVRHPLIVLDLDLRIKMANRAFYQRFQLSPLEAEGQLLYSLSDGAWNLPGLRRSMDGILAGSPFLDLEAERDFPRAGHRTLVLGASRIPQLNMILLAIDDITERKLAQMSHNAGEAHLRQSQKMESLGRLAGGIAHDFNNLLTIIVGRGGLLRDLIGGNEPAAAQLAEIVAAGEMAASLTRQLLSFSRRQVLRPELLDLNGIVSECDRMLQRLVGERIHVVLKFGPLLWRVKVDSGEISRALLNLCLNARDAMPDGGTLTIETANVVLTGSEGFGETIRPGPYVVMAVIDTGSGIDPDLQAHIFEPFFTTKDVGKGTGLGLATVLGIVGQSDGAIRCDSVPGQGTTFKIFLPAVPALVYSKLEPSIPPPAPKGSEVILLVEDQEMVRHLARDVLQMRGYVVHEASDGEAGLAFCEAYEGRIDLLLSDAVMPGLGGRDFAEKAVKLRPGIKVLFVSGHTQDVVLKEGIQMGTPFLQKPYTPSALVQKVRETLDAA